MKGCKKIHVRPLFIVFLTMIFAILNMFALIKSWYLRVFNFPLMLFIFIVIVFVAFQIFAFVKKKDKSKTSATILTNNSSQNMENPKCSSECVVVDAAMLVDVKEIAGDEAVSNEENKIADAKNNETDNTNGINIKDETKVFNKVKIFNKFKNFCAMLKKKSALLLQKLTRALNYFSQNSKLINVIMAVFIITFLFSSFFLMPFFEHRKFEGESVIVGEVVQVTEYVGYKTIKLDNSHVINNKETHKLISGINVLINGFFDISAGDKLTLESEIYLSPYYNNYEKLGAFISGYAYSITVDATSIVSINTNKNVGNEVKNHTKLVLLEHLNEENAMLAYGILFGDRVDLAQHIKTNFSYVGISHILAVSGLNVTIIVLSLYLILKVLRINRYANAVIVALFVVFYCYLCNFTDSVMRAGIMGVVLVLCNLFGKRFDGLNALSLSGIIILALNPRYLFSVGFQLSFLCVFAMICLAGDMSKILQKIGVPTLIASSFAVSISVNIVILPILANVFNHVSLVSVFANILVVPLFSLAYVMIFYIIALSFAFGFIGGLLIAPALILHLVKTLANYMAMLPFAYIMVFRVGFFAIALIVLLCLVVKYFMISRRVKSIAVATIFVIFTLMITLSNIPAKINENFLFVEFQYSKNHVYYYHKDYGVTVIGSPTRQELGYQLIDNNIAEVENVVAYDFEINKYDEFLEMVFAYRVKNVYLPSYLEQFCYSFYLLEQQVNLFFLNDYTYVCDYNLVEINNDVGKLIALKMNSANSNLLVLNTTQNISNAKTIGEGIDRDIDMVFANRVRHNLFEHTDFNIEQVIFHRENALTDVDNVDLFNKTNFTKKI